MTLKKIALLGLLISITASTSSTAFPYPELRTQGLVNAGLILTLGGIYQLVKRSENHTVRITDIFSGLTLVAAGISTIFLSSQLLTEIDNSFK